MDTTVLVRSFLENIETNGPCVHCEQEEYDEYDEYVTDEEYEDDGYDEDEIYTEESVNPNNIRAVVRNLIESVENPEYDEEQSLQEVGTSTIKITKNRKLKMLTGLSAVRIAKKKEDPLYSKYKKHRDMALKYKAMLVKKNKSKAKAVARKALR